jgi:hypothetical protein
MQDPIAISAFALSSRSERRDCHVALSNRQKNQGQPSDGQTVTRIRNPMRCIRPNLTAHSPRCSDSVCLLGYFCRVRQSLGTSKDDP